MTSLFERAGVRAEWQERPKTLARLQRIAATAFGSRCQFGNHREFPAICAVCATGVHPISETKKMRTVSLEERN